MNDIVYWIWLSLAVTPGSDTFRKLIEKFETVAEIYNADETDIINCIGSKSKDLNAVSDKDLKRANEIFDFCNSKKVGILTYDDDNFPNPLRQIKNPPVLLYYRGILPDFEKSCLIAMVGTRRLSEYGRKNAFVIGHDLATAGFTLVSGMAIGIDGVSHAGSLSAGGVNVAFLGSGIDVCYPQQHKRLAREIVKNGCVMTEYCPGTQPNGHNFPIRNRLIAGISCASVVIEGTERSGSIITARYSKEYGKTIYALPGNVDNKTSEVTNLLIKNGAKLITCSDDIVSDLEFVYPGIINPFKLKKKLDVNMNDVFLELEISCVAPTDNIFSSFASKLKRKDKRPKKTEKAEGTKNDIAVPSEQNQTVDLQKMDFDKTTLEIYKKIPLDGGCTIESLASDEYRMTVVMKSLLKLEMGSFIVMLPGEKVKRNLR